MESSGLEPWTMVAGSAALMAHVRFAETPEQVDRRDRLARELLDKGRRLLGMPDNPFLDFPVTGMMLAAVGAWLLQTGGDEDAAVRLLALAHAFSYNRTFPVMAWAPLAQAADSVRPGLLAALLEEYDGRPGRELTGEVADLLVGIG
jgi:hypothetical protein